MTAEENDFLLLAMNATPSQRKAARPYLTGEAVETIDVSITNRHEPIDRVLTRGQVAQILGCTKKTVTTYARRGIIRAIRNGEKGLRANGYSEQSVRKLMANGVKE